MSLQVNEVPAVGNSASVGEQSLQLSVQGDSNPYQKFLTTLFINNKLIFSELNREFCHEIQELYPHRGDVDPLAAADLEKLDISKPETYQQLKERWGLAGLQKMSEETIKEKVVPVAKAYFAAQGDLGLNGYIQRFGSQMEVLGIQTEEVASDMMDAEIALLNDLSKNIKWEDFLKRNTFQFPGSMVVKFPMEFMTSKQKEAVIPQFIEYAVTLNRNNFASLFEECAIYCQLLNLTERAFAQHLVAKHLDSEKDYPLNQLREKFGLHHELVSDENRERLKEAYFRMHPSVWASEKYILFREKLGIEVGELLETLRDRYNFWKKDKIYLPTIFLNWDFVGDERDRQLLAMLEEILTQHQKNAAHTQFVRDAILLVDEATRKHLRDREKEIILGDHLGFIHVCEVVKFNYPQDLGKEVIQQELERAEGDFGSFYQRNGISGWNYVVNKEVFKDSFMTWISGQDLNTDSFQFHVSGIAASMGLDAEKILSDLIDRRFNAIELSADQQKAVEGAFNHFLRD